LYGLIGIIILIVGSLIIDWLIPYNFHKEIFEKKNPAVGALVAGIFIGLAIIIRSVIVGG
jgi:putative membrane protein